MVMPLEAATVFAHTQVRTEPTILRSDLQFGIRVHADDETRPRLLRRLPSLRLRRARRRWWDPSKADPNRARQIVGGTIGWASWIPDRRTDRRVRRC